MSANLAGEAQPWSSLLDFIGLPDAGMILCAGKHAADLTDQVSRRGLQAVAVMSAADAAGVQACRRVVAALEALPVRDACLSGVVWSGALHRHDDPERLLAELRRTLRPAGLLVVHQRVEGCVNANEDLTPEELCAHLAGEQLAVLAHRQEDGAAIWVLQVPGG